VLLGFLRACPALFWGVAGLGAGPGPPTRSAGPLVGGAGRLARRWPAGDRGPGATCYTSRGALVSIIQPMAMKKNRVLGATPAPASLKSALTEVEMRRRFPGVESICDDALNRSGQLGGPRNVEVVTIRTREIDRNHAVAITAPMRPPCQGVDAEQAAKGRTGKVDPAKAPGVRRLRGQCHCAHPPGERKGNVKPVVTRTAAGYGMVTILASLSTAVTRPMDRPDRAPWAGLGCVAQAVASGRGSDWKCGLCSWATWRK
jgi:hypothetical protein